jgi:hypothetical protein
VICTCVELLVEEVDREGDATGQAVRLRPPALHNCEYVQKRNELIPLAWGVAQRKAKNSGERDRIFHAEMTRLVAEAYKAGSI